MAGNVASVSMGNEEENVGVERVVDDKTGEDALEPGRGGEVTIVLLFAFALLLLLWISAWVCGYGAGYLGGRPRPRLTLVAGAEARLAVASKVTFEVEATGIALDRAKEAITTAAGA